MAILVANILFFIGYAFMYGGAAYFFKYLYLAPEATKLGVLAIGIGAMAFPPLWVAIARRFSKSITWVAGSALPSAAFLRSDGRRVGQVVVSTGRFGWLPDN